MIFFFTPAQVVMIINLLKRRSRFKFYFIGDDFFQIRNRILRLMKKLNWKSGFYRKDIGWKIIKKMRIISGSLKGKN